MSSHFREFYAFSSSSEEIEFIICCTEEDHEGKIDYAAFKETYYEPSKAIGFNMAVLLTNLSEHMTTDPRLVKHELLTNVSSFCQQNNTI